MKKILYILSILIIVCPLIFYGCDKQENYILKIKGIEIFISDVYNTNTYPISFLSVNIIDDEKNVYQIYNKENPNYIITRPYKSYGETYFSPNKQQIVNLKNDNFQIIINLTIIDNNKEINLNKTTNICIITNQNSIGLKQEQYKDTIIADLVNIKYDNNKETTHFTLNFSYDIKKY